MIALILNRLLVAVAFVVLLALFSLSLLSAPAFAANGDAQVGPVDTTIHTIQVISLFIGVVLPIAVGLVTKRVTAESTKAWLLAGLSAISGFATEYAQATTSGTDFNFVTAILTWGGTFIVAVAVHFGLWVPTGVSAKAQDSLVK